MTYAEYRGPQSWTSDGSSHVDGLAPSTRAWMDRSAARGRWRQHIGIPGWRAGARRAVCGSERLVGHAGRPALGGIPLGKPKERRAVGDALCGALENEVDTSERDGKDAARVRSQVPT